ncbi:uncharacterized protein LOC134201236 [Bombyx mori]|uniref:uncharacterized protein LOC134201236 n=1 Tax=Bombyx mori TaxID=7091 RepID=UPI002ED4FCE4
MSTSARDGCLYRNDTYSLPQQPEINDQFDKTSPTSLATTSASISNTVRRNNPETITTSLYKTLTTPIFRIVSIPKVATVLRNIGTCIVNGAMELISFYLPAPLMPLVASAAGFMIPFEPVVMLKEKMPVNSYRRALRTAVNSFMGTFDKYKVNEDLDPYMTGRFNRRFNRDSKERKDLE